jgi:CSLREA domain-containing protein
MTSPARSTIVGQLRRALAMIALSSLSALVAIAAGSVPAASADTTINVTTQTDETNPNNGLCSLREAIDLAAGAAEPDCPTAGLSGEMRIVVPAGCYRLSQTRLILGGTLVIEGAGAGPPSCSAGGTVIKQEGADQVLYNPAGTTATLSGLTLTGGHGGGQGGGVLNGGALTLRDVLVTGNTAGSGQGFTDGRGRDGGGIYNEQGATLTAVDSAIRSNSAGAGAPSDNGLPAGNGGDGGGILDEGGTVTLRDSTISDNAAGAGSNGVTFRGNGTAGGVGGVGGAISITDNGSLNVEDSTIAGNRAGNGGTGGEGVGAGNGGPGGESGGIYSDGSVTLKDSTISGNVAGAGGAGGPGGSGGPGGPGGLAGGIYNGDVLSVTDVTVAGNSAAPGGAGGFGLNGQGPSGSDGVGGAIYTDGAINMTHATIANNTAPGGVGGIYADPSTIALETASIVAANNPPNCLGPLLDEGHNVVSGDQTCPGVEADPKLTPLRYNGGPTQTIALGAGSVAIDLIPPASGCPATDQRGIARPQGTGCDAGAYELAPPLISSASATTTSPTTATLKATVNPNLQDTTMVARYGTTTAYGPTTATKDTGAGNTPTAVAIPLGGLAPGATYHAQLILTNADGTSRSADLVFTTPANRNLKPVAPSLSHIRQSARRWVEGNKQASIGAKRKLAVGTTFSFQINETATAKFVFTQKLAGRAVDRRCVARTRRNARNPRCTRSVIGGTLAFRAHAGVNKVRFDGRLPRHRKLSPGAYTLVIVAIDTAGRRSPRARLAFKILRRRA